MGVKAGDGAGRLMNLVAAWPRLMRPDVAAEYVGGQSILRRMLAVNLLNAFWQRHRLTLFDRKDLDAACDQIEVAFPPKERKPRRYSVPAKIRIAVLNRDGWTCRYCFKAANSVDHVLAFSSGGGDEESNLVAACMDCNRRKRNKPVEEFACVIQN